MTKTFNRLLSPCRSFSRWQSISICYPYPYTDCCPLFNPSVISGWCPGGGFPIEVHALAYIWKIKYGGCRDKVQHWMNGGGNGTLKNDSLNNNHEMFLLIFLGRSVGGIWFSFRLLTIPVGCEYLVVSGECDKDAPSQESIYIKMQTLLLPHPESHLDVFQAVRCVSPNSSTVFL